MSIRVHMMKWTEYISKHYDSTLDLAHHVAVSTSDRGLDIASRALAIIAPLPNAISLFSISQSHLGFGPMQALAFAGALELSMFALTEITLDLYDGYIDKPDEYRKPMSVMLAVDGLVLSIIVALVVRLEVVSTGHVELALLPLLSACCAIGIALKRWNEKNSSTAVSVVSPEVASPSERRSAILDALAENDSLSFVDLANQVYATVGDGLPESTLRKDLAKLVKSSIVTKSREGNSVTYTVKG